MSETTNNVPENCPVLDGNKEEPKEGAVQKCSPKCQRHRGPKILAVGEVIEGKREKKTVQRLDYQMLKPKEKLKIENGGGDKLGDIARTNHNITKMKPVDLKPLHVILFDRPGKVGTMRKDIRQFNGFPFEVDSDPFIKKREKMLRTATLTNTKLKTICKALELERSGPQPVIIDRILTYLVEPKNNGKPLILKKKKKSKKNILGNASKRKSKDKPKSASVSPKKAKAQSKSKAIVTDSSSDDEDEEGQQEITVELDWSELEKGGGKTPKKEETSNDETEDSEEEDEFHESNTAKEKTPAKKTLAIKRTQAAKKVVTPKKKVKEDASEQSGSDSDNDPKDSESEVEKPKKKAAAKRAPKRAAPAKPAAKTKKADSSSNRQKKSTAADGSTDDDEPLIKMIKKTPAPSDTQLKETVQGLLRDANLEEMTMKQICQKVYDTYPDHDLTNRKDYIKQTVKTLIL